MALGLATPVKQSGKLLVGCSSPNLAINIDIPASIDASAYVTVLALRIANDFEILTTGVEATRQVILSSTHEDATSMGVEMSERIAKIEQRLEHIEATLQALNSNVDKLLEYSRDEKATNTVLKDKFVEYDKKLDKKPSSDEVKNWVARATVSIILAMITIIGIASTIIVKITHQ
ncbi:hypothetical protein ABC733_17325 [Mangrovibacter sp. SLW1]